MVVKSYNGISQLGIKPNDTDDTRLNYARRFDQITFLTPMKNSGIGILSIKLVSTF
jgi:hypothetical protein